MKKWIAFTLVFVLAFVFAGCKTTPDDDTDPNDPIKAASIEISASKTEIKVGETLTLSHQVKPTGAKQEVNWSSANTAIATVDANGVVTGVSSGDTEIIATAKENSNVVKRLPIKVREEVVVVEPTGVTITGSTNEVTLSRNITLKATVEPSDKASQDVTWTSQNPEIATVTNGVVKGIAVGETVITVSVVAKPELTNTYNIKVVEEVIGPIDEDPTDIIVEGETEMFAQTSIYLTASVLPNGANQGVTWTSLKPTIATVSASGEVNALAEGTVFIKVASVVNPELFINYKIVVKAAPYVPPYPDMGGYQIKIMAAGHAMYEHDPFLEEYKVLDKTAKQKAWLEVEKNFNCDLAVVPYPDIAPWGQQRIDWINNNATLGAAEMDIFVSTTDWLKVLADGGSILDTTTFYQTYGQNSMAASAKAASTYQGGLYALPTVSAAGLQVDKGLFYNVALVERLGLPSPAKLFMDGEWTWTGFQNYVKNANALLQEGQSVLSGRPVLYWMGMANAAGVKLADTVTLEMNFNHPYARTAANILTDLYTNVGWGDIAWDAAVTSFNEGNSIFQSGDLWFVRTANRWKDTLWDESGNSRFGYVPYPYPDSMQKSNTRTVGAGGACYMMSDARQYGVGVTAEHVYRAFTEMMLNTTKYMKADPTYDEDGIMRLAAAAKVSDPNSVEALVFFKRDKVIFDPLYSLLSVAGNIGPAIDRIVTQSADYNEVLDVQKDLYLARLLELYS